MMMIEPQWTICMFSFGGGKGDMLMKGGEIFFQVLIFCLFFFFFLLPFKFITTFAF